MYLHYATISAKEEKDPAYFSAVLWVLVYQTHADDGTPTIETYGLAQFGFLELQLQGRIANQRKDMLHKRSTKRIRENDIICMEDLAVKNMVKNHNLAKSIADASWGEFRRQLTYKAEWYGRKLVVIDRFYPSSQMCSACGTLWSGTKDLAVRKWTCPDCGTVHDRDVNAAKNILAEGLRMLA